jgi:outer membrane lipoprotein SlyB
MRKLLLIPALLFAFACGKKDSAVDSALNADLQQAASSTQVVSPLEQNGTALRSNSTTKTRVVYRNRPRSSGTSTSTTTTQQTTVVKNTKRDAVIGAGAGAVIGAVTSRNKVKGAIIGGAAGAILGGIIGNNVDKTTVKK